MTRRCLFSALCSAVLASSALAHDLVEYQAEIQPIFDRSCAGSTCHIGQTTSGVDLSNWETLMASVGAQYGKSIVVALAPTESPLVDKLSSAQPLHGLREPNGQEPLPDGEIARIVNWISEGAKRTQKLRRGDFNGNDRIDISDPVALLVHLFAAGAAPRCAVLADSNSDGAANVTDVIFTLNYLFAGGPTPADLTHEEQDACRVANELSFQSIYDKVLKVSCASSSCHSTVAHKGGLALGSVDESYQNLVGVMSANETVLAEGVLRVAAGEPEASFLLTKVVQPGPGEGNKMPPNSSVGISASAIAAIREWILAGAPRDGTIRGVPDLTNEPEPTFGGVPQPAVPTNGVQVHVPPFAIAARSEREVFYYVAGALTALPEDPIVSQIDTHMLEDSHHFILYEWTGGGTPPAGFRNSANVADLISGHRFLLGAQQSYFSLKFPPGVGIRMSRNIKFDLNSHYVNLSGSQTLMGEVYTNIFFAEPGTVTTIAKPIFDINPFINVPPNATRTTKAVFPMDASGRVPAGKEYHVYALSSHMHRHGVRFKVFLVQNLQDVNPPQVVYDNLDWDDPIFKPFDPPMVLTAGQGLRFEVTHTYDDPPTDNSPALTFGGTSEDEMAILLGYYAIK